MRSREFGGGRLRSEAALALVALFALVGCRQDMHDQPRLEPYEVSDFFADGVGARLPVEGTVARGWLREDDHLYRGIGDDGSFATEAPMAVDRALLERGRERYDIFCSPCHGRVGDGRGMIVQRGFKQPNSFHDERLRSMPIGYFFDVQTNGFGEMSSYSAQVPVADRWAIAAYVHALQLSQNVAAVDLSAADREALEESR